MSPVDCPAPGHLAACYLGMRSEPDLEAVAGHVEHCPRCRAAVEALDRADDALLARLRRPPEPAPAATAADLPNLLAALKTFGPPAAPATASGTRPGHGPGEETTRDWQPPPGSADEHTVLARLAGGHLALEDSPPVVLRDYQFLRRIGKGGMGVVYQARHTKLKRVVAVKVMAAKPAEGPEAAARFRRELEAIGKLDHPNVVRAYDAGEVGGIPFLVMEFLEGHDLARLLRGRPGLPIGLACEMVRQAALGLQHAHEHGLVHRDIKPSNLWWTPAGQVKVLDLGLARLHDARAPDEPLTAPGQVMGTIDYMAPEQLEHAGAVDIRADVYSLGCTLYHLLAGRPPFPDGGIRERIIAHQFHQPEPLPTLRPGLPAGLPDVVARMMAKAPAERYPTPGAVAAALQPFARGKGRQRPARSTPLEPPVPAPENAPRPRRLAARLVPFLAAACLVLAAGVTFHLAVGGRGTRVPESPGGMSDARPPGEPAPCAPAPNGPAPSAPAPPAARARDTFPGDCAVFSADGKVLTGSADGSLRLWDIATSQVTGQARAPYPVTCVALLPGGQAVAAGQATVVTVWDLQTAAEVGRLDGHSGFINSVAVSPDGRRALTAGADQTARLWDLVKHAELDVFEHPEAVTAAVFAQDGRSVLTGCMDGALRLWGPKAPRTLDGHGERVNGVAATATGPRALSAGGWNAECTLRFWSLATGREEAGRRVTAPAGNPFLCVAVTPDGRRAVSGSLDGTVQVWDFRTARRLADFHDHAGAVRTVAFAADGRHIVSAGADHVARIRVVPPEPQRAGGR